MRQYHIFTVGWDPPFARYFMAPIAAQTGFLCTHGIVGDARRVPVIRQQYPEGRWVSISKAAADPLPQPDYELLASLEGDGVPTMRSMVRGDRVLRYRPPDEAFGYATLLARRLFAALEEAKPDLVLGSYDSIHAAVGLGVARALGIPWVAMAFTVIPDDRTWFCRGLTPDQMVPTAVSVNDSLRQRATELMERVRSRNVQVAAYRPPQSFGPKVRQVLAHGRNLGRRLASRDSLGVDRYTYPTIAERAADLARRKRNSLALRGMPMLHAPPERRYAFFPLHMAPESTVDTWAPMYQNQLGLAMQVALALPAHVDLVVKLHFSDPDSYSPDQLDPLARTPGVHIAHPGASAAAFLERASLVVGIAGTANLEAALLGKPVLLFGDSPYQHFPATRRAVQPDGLHLQVRDMLDLNPPTDAEIVEAYAAYLARFMPGRINDWGRPITDVERKRLAACFEAICRLASDPAVRDSWYKQPPFAGDSTAAVHPRVSAASAASVDITSILRRSR